MEKTIPLHSLVVVLSNATKNQLSGIFPEHEITSASAISCDLVGSGARFDLGSIVQNELKRRIAVKLSLGERVVVHGLTVRRDWRIPLVRMAAAQGASIVYVIDPEIVVDDDILDGQSETAIFGVDRIVAVRKLPDDPLKALKKKFRGVTVVADVHGNLHGLSQAIKWAQNRNHFLWFLGDVLDYGRGSIEAINIVYHLVMRGKAACLIGNHERKIAKWLQKQEDQEHHTINLSEGNLVTVNAINAMNHKQRAQWVGRFRGLIARCSLISELDTVTLAHAAVHPSYWDGEDGWEMMNYALYGEPTQLPGAFRLRYDWLNAVPPGQTVIVGHDIRSGIPFGVSGTKGGRVIFLDTGSGKGGPLSTADFRFGSKNKIYLENFNSFSKEIA